MSDAALAGFRERIRSAAATATKLCIRGGGSKDFYGDSGEPAHSASVLDTRGYAGIVDYDPAELVITARCGTPLAEIEQALAEKRQMLAFEPPHFGAGATLGGCVAAGLAGPRRMACGSVRDFVLGAILMDGRGETLSFGGQVMKNVAGYDISRLMAGSLGTLALILEVSLKLLPQPVEACSLRFECEQAEALRRLNGWAGQPLPISASAWHRGVLHLRLSGARAAVTKAAEALSGEVLEGDAAKRFWDELREQRHGFFGDATATGRSPPTLWRLALPPTAPALEIEEETLIEWGGAQRWLRSEREPAELRALARTAGGHAVAFRRADPGIATFEALPAPLAAIHRRLKTAFDPQGVFDGARLSSAYSG